MDWLAIVATAVWAMLPAYVPNNAAVLVGGGRPIDGGRHWRGARVLGDGKTWRGTAGGVLAGALLAVLLNVLRAPAAEVTGVALASFPPAVALALPAGAMAGDLASSLLKRRLGRERGAALPGLDQLDFVAGALVLALFVAPAWTTATFGPPELLVVLVLTPLLHVGTNAIAYALGLKGEPW